MAETTGLSEPLARVPAGADGWLARRLASPALWGDARLLARHWRETVIYATCRVPRGCLPGLWLSYAMRGAVGARLFHQPPRVRGEPSPYMALMRPVHLQIGGRHVGAPMLFDLSWKGRELLVKLRLLGFAAIWREAATEALLEALAGGISIAENAPVSRPFPVEDMHWQRRQGLGSLPAVARRGVLVCPETPLCYGAREHDPGRPERLILSALTRVGGLARWQGIGLTGARPGMGALQRRLEIRFASARPVEAVMKNSRGHRGHTAPLRGERSVFRIWGLAPEELRLLAIAGHVGAGGHTAWGFGRFQVLSA